MLSSKPRKLANSSAVVFSQSLAVNSTLVLKCADDVEPLTSDGWDLIGI